MNRPYRDATGQTLYYSGAEANFPGNSPQAPVAPTGAGTQYTLNPDGKSYTQTRPYSTTTASNANIIEKVVPKIKADLKTATQPTLSTGDYGETYKDGKPVASTVPEGVTFQNDTYSASGSVADEAQNVINLQNEIFAQVERQTDSVTQGIIANIRAQSALQQKLQADINARQSSSLEKTLIMGGSQRYARRSSEGIAEEQSRYGALQIAELQNQESSLILEATQAAKSQNWQRVGVILAEANKKQEAKQKLAQDLNEKFVEENKILREQDRLNSIDKAVAESLGSGEADLSAILVSLSASGLNASSKEVREAMTNITGEADPAKLGQDVRDFNYFKALGLPDDIAALPANQQFLAWQKANKEATTSDPSTRYQAIVDSVTGDRYSFDRMTNTFSGGQPSGTEGMNGGDAVILNAAKSLAIRNPSGGKLLVRDVINKLSQGDSIGALEMIKTTALNSLDATSQQWYRGAESSNAAAEAALAILNNPDASAGPYKALFESKKPWVMMEQDPKYKGLRQWVALSDAPVRLKYYGASVTGGETTVAGNFLFDETDTVDSIRNKLKGNLAFNSYVNDLVIATTAGLPRPNLDEYLVKFGVNTANLSGIDDDLLDEGGGAVKSDTNPAGI